tara:strand:+ start:7290 stop:7625 length:336 start_codon:yes stop_codon:yes gene_type:complete
MIIGKLDTPITLKRQTFVTNAYGEREVDTTTVQTIWADFTYKNGNTKFEADNLTNTEVIECMIRFRTDIGTSRHYVIAIGSQNYTIESVREIGRKDYMMLTLKQQDFNTVL